MAMTKINLGGLRFDLVPTYGQVRVAEVYTVGAKKHGENGWRYGMQFSYCISKLFRHLYRWLRGERYDKDDGQHHLASVVFWCYALMEFEGTHPEMDDFHHVIDLTNMEAEEVAKNAS